MNEILLSAFIFVLFFICVIIMSLCEKDNVIKIGGGKYVKSPHIIIDLLNLTYWLNNKKSITQEMIIEAVDKTSSELLKHHEGRVMYVLKDRESLFNDNSLREIYKQTANRNGVYIYMVERYQEPVKGVALSTKHSSLGRDDMFIAILAQRWKCEVLTEDRLRDFNEFRTTIQPFHVYEFAFWRQLHYLEFIRPESSSYILLKKPRTIKFNKFLQQYQN